ncbi:aldehyde dehydrogenase [Microbacterium barkeri]|uniref:Aldehyde dehydrogenase n=1 Tax=Microbacterium barkeri TaxID=33917 RepID=A0A9W6LXW7_9MICO|nr:aldehyde dehydrogenase [Microbacterium barkeri]MDR6877853.1 acyl-CoA reductase-like NAD-dependent aldehyde dehydrogenase [Microbacterium barkeri]GLJ62921.1 aldehyde dehydrogenase [Microbacterium barkeri]
MTTASESSIADARQAVADAAAAFPLWSAQGPGARRAVLSAAADELVAMAPEIIDAMQDELGATLGWAQFNIGLAADMLREAAALTTAVQGRTIPSDKPGALAMSLRVPAGVVLGIAPWNAPIILGVRAIATPLACGNTVVLKASELCPRTHGLIVEAFRRSGAPEGILMLVTNDPAEAAEVVGALIDEPAVRRVNFTGSTAVGRVIAQRAAANLKPALLELGGKAPFIVLEDADIDEAVTAARFGAFMNQGQICMSTERIIVVDAVADEFVSRFAAAAAALTAGDPRAGDHPLGALVSDKAADHVRGLVEDAAERGATVAAGGVGDGRLMPATVLDGVTADMRVYGEESFGPVVSVIRARDLEDAVRIANDTAYGLSSSVFTRDIATAFAVAQRLHAGMCHINGATVHDEAHMPFGGVGDSGYGRFGGEAGIAEFTDLRWITVDTLPGAYPL